MASGRTAHVPRANDTGYGTWRQLPFRKPETTNSSTRSKPLGALVVLGTAVVLFVSSHLYFTGIVDHLSPGKTYAGSRSTYAREIIHLTREVKDTMAKFEGGAHVDIAVLTDRVVHLTTELPSVDDHEDLILSESTKVRRSPNNKLQKPAETDLWKAQWSEQYGHWYWWNTQTYKTTWSQPASATNSEQIASLQAAVAALLAKVSKNTATLTQNAELPESSKREPPSDVPLPTEEPPAASVSLSYTSKQTFVDKDVKPANTLMWPAVWSDKYNQWYWWNTQTRETAWEQPAAAVAEEQRTQITTLKDAIDQLSAVVNAPKPQPAPTAVDASGGGSSGGSSSGAGANNVGYGAEASMYEDPTLDSRMAAEELAEATAAQAEAHAARQKLNQHPGSKVVSRMAAEEQAEADEEAEEARHHAAHIRAKHTLRTPEADASVAGGDEESLDMTGLHGGAWEVHTARKRHAGADLQSPGAAGAGEAAPGVEVSQADNEAEEATAAQETTANELADVATAEERLRQLEVSGATQEEIEAAQAVLAKQKAEYEEAKAYAEEEKAEAVGARVDATGIAEIAPDPMSDAEDAEEDVDGNGVHADGTKVYTTVGGERLTVAADGKVLKREGGAASAFGDEEDEESVEENSDASSGAEDDDEGSADETEESLSGEEDEESAEEGADLSSDSSENEESAEENPDVSSGSEEEGVEGGDQEVGLL